MSFYHISELMLATLIQKYDKKPFHFKNETLKFYRLPGATFYDCINTIYQFIKPFLDNKMSIFEEYGAFNLYNILQHFATRNLRKKAFLTFCQINISVCMRGPSAKSHVKWLKSPLGLSLMRANSIIMKTRLFKYIENFHHQKLKIFRQKTLTFFIFLLIT